MTDELKDVARIGAQRVHPHSDFVTSNGDVVAVGGPGMTLRQWYAGLAMQGMVADPSLCPDLPKTPANQEWLLQTIANVAVRQADALLKELNRE